MAISFSLTEQLIIDPILVLREPHPSPEQDQAANWTAVVWQGIESEVIARVIAIFTSVFAAADAFVHFAIGVYKGSALLVGATYDKSEIYDHFRQVIWFAGLTVIGSVAGALWPGIFKLCRSDVSPPEEPVHRGIEASDNPVFPSSEPSNCRVRLSWGDREARVRVGEAFSIHLQHSYSTGHMPWEVSQTPSFINRVENYVRPGSNLPGAGNDYVFVFEANGPGRGEIFMQQPCLFNASRTEQYRFSIIAE